MLVRVTESCAESCGVRVRGEVNTSTLEFVHRFALPPGAEALIPSRSTEVEGIRLVTFAPDAREWFVDCPLCGKQIHVATAPA